MKNRYLSFDVTRIVALMMIVMVHVSAYVVIFFPETDKVEWTVGNLFNGLARAGVPLFIMLSGALLLNEDKPMRPGRFYKKSLLPMGLLAAGWLVAYGLFYAVALPLMEGKPVELSAFWGFLTRFQGSEYPHLWYMLMVVGMYLMIPVLRLFVKRENKRYILGILVAALVVQFGARTADYFTLNCQTSASAFLGKFHLEPATGFLGLLLAGWYLSQFPPKARVRWTVYALGLISVVASTLAVHFDIDRVPQVRDFVYSESSLPAFLYGVALFVLVQALCAEKKTQSRLVATVADCSFGVYLLHVAVLELFVRLVLPYEAFGSGKPLSYIAITYGVTLLLPLAVVYLAGRVKGVRRAFFTGKKA